MPENRAGAFPGAERGNKFLVSDSPNRSVLLLGRAAYDFLILHFDTLAFLMRENPFFPAFRPACAEKRTRIAVTSCMAAG